MDSFVDWTGRLAHARAAHHPGSRTPHTVVVLPSYSVGDSLLAHYAHRVPALEHRYLLGFLGIPRVPTEQLIFLTSLRPSPQVIDYYLSLVPPEQRRDMRARVRIVEVPDRTTRALSAKLLDRPDLIARVRSMVGGRLGYVDPWNVTSLETEVARRLGMPLNGTPPELWPLGFKSNGRRVMRQAGVPLPLGHEDVRSVDDVVAAAEDVRRCHPEAVGVVIKSDNSGTGDGNRVIRFADAAAAGGIRAAVEALEPWYLSDIELGAVVEELVVGSEFRSPSVQVDVAPGGHVEVISTHEQLLGGANDQVYLGCRFPAAPDYRTLLAAYGAQVGRELAGLGAMGRLCVDFAVVRTRGTWRVYGLEINLRKGGTTHPFSALTSLVPGHLDGRRGTWVTEDGGERSYRSTDNLVDQVWRGRGISDVIDAIRGAGLEFDRVTGTGIVLHMFSGLDIDGRLGLNAIGHSPSHAERLYQAAVNALAVDRARTGVPQLA
jgi:hypothetical protein